MSTVSTHTIRFDHFPDVFTLNTSVNLLKRYTNVETAEAVTLTIKLTSTHDDDPATIPPVNLALFDLPTTQPKT